MLYDGDKAIGVLGPRQLEDLHAKGKIAIPMVKESDIEDRSKADALSKALVIVQTTWFVTQCIARKQQGLVIPQFELVTAALAVLNGIMYFLWWHKPLNVQSTIPVYLLATKSYDVDHDEKTEEPGKQFVYFCLNRRKILTLSIAIREVSNVKNLTQSDSQQGPKLPLETSSPVSHDAALEKTS